MDNYDLDTITRDDLLIFTRTTTREKLLELLNSAKDEFEKYTNCSEEANGCERQIELQKKLVSTPDNAKMGCGFFTVFSLVIVILSLVSAFSSGKDISTMLALLTIPLLFFIIYLILSLIVKRRIESAKSSLKKYEEQLPILKKKKEEAMEFKALLFIPGEYWFEYALSWMFQYIRKGSADNWKEVTRDFDKHWQDLKHQTTMENIAKKTLEESKLQTELAQLQVELANKTLSATRWAAAGSWASAAGIWRINSKL